MAFITLSSSSDNLGPTERQAVEAEDTHESACWQQILHYEKHSGVFFLRKKKKKEKYFDM